MATALSKHTRSTTHTRRVPDARRDHGMATGTHCSNTHCQQHDTCRVPDARKDHGMATDTYTVSITHCQPYVNHTTCAVYRMPAGITGWPATHSHASAHMSLITPLPMHTAPAHQAASARRRLAQTRESQAKLGGANPGADAGVRGCGLRVGEYGRGPSPRRGL